MNLARRARDTEALNFSKAFSPGGGGGSSEKWEKIQWSRYFLSVVVTAPVLCMQSSSSIVNHPHTGPSQCLTFEASIVAYYLQTIN